MLRHKDQNIKAMRGIAASSVLHLLAGATILRNELWLKDQATIGGFGTVGHTLHWLAVIAGITLIVLSVAFWTKQPGLVLVIWTPVFLCAGIYGGLLGWASHEAAVNRSEEHTSEL